MHSVSVWMIWLTKVRTNPISRFYAQFSGAAGVATFTTAGQIGTTTGKTPIVMLM